MPGERMIQAQVEGSPASRARNAGWGRFGGAMLALLSLAAVAAVCWLVYWLEAERIEEQQRQRETLRVRLLTQLTRSELAPVVDTLRLLADGDGLRNFLENQSPAG